MFWRIAAGDVAGYDDIQCTRSSVNRTATNTEITSRRQTSKKHRIHTACFVYFLTRKIKIKIILLVYNKEKKKAQYYKVRKKEEDKKVMKLLMLPNLSLKKKSINNSTKIKLWRYSEK